MVSIGFVRLSPPAVSSLPTCDDIMVLNAKTCHPRKLFACQSCRENGQRAGRSCAIRRKRKTTKHGFESVVTRHSTDPTADHREAIVGTFFDLRSPFASSANGSKLETSLPMCGRTRTRARRGLARPGRSKPLKARAPTDRVRPAEPRSAFRRSDVAVAFSVALPWQPRFPRISRGAPVQPAEHRGNA